MIELQPPVRSSEKGGLTNLASFRYLQARQGQHTVALVLSRVSSWMAHFDVGASAHVPCGRFDSDTLYSNTTYQSNETNGCNFYLNAHTRWATRLHVHDHVWRLAHDLRLAYGVL